MTGSPGGMGGGHQRVRGEVAIIGMACIFPGAPDLDAYWQNILSGVDAITDVPPGRWDPEVFFDPTSTADDRLYCKRGGYLGDLAQFNPLEYGIMPVVVDGGEAEQFLSLRVAHEALADAGYAERPFSRERTEIILGRGNYSNRGISNVTWHTQGLEEILHILRSLHPEYTAQELAALKRELKASLPHFGPDTASGLIPNLTTGRVANRFDLMGANFTVDAACASALIAVDLAVRDLLTDRCDLALGGGIHLVTHVPFLALFCQLNALSRRSQIRPFDKDADGTIPGEGVGIVVLKRREDAERDGDRIYAVIKGVGIASDGRGQGPLAPRVEGEELAIRRAYEAADIPPDSVELIEAHGTAMPVGDLAEIQALARVFGVRKGPLPTCAIGAVKSMIGHLMPAAGIAGLIKATLAVHHKVLPPTLHCDTPNPEFDLEKTPFYINTETRPWIHGAQDPPRRAGVSAFGFGGINTHAILEEAPGSGECGGPSRPRRWETEVCLVQGATRQDLLQQVQRLARYVDAAGPVDLKDLAYTLNTDLHNDSLCLALVASSVEDLRQKLPLVEQRLTDSGCRQIKDVGGVYFFEDPLRRIGKLAFLFPGETSQYSNMLRDLCLHFPEVRAAFDSLDQLFHRKGRPFLPSQCIFPVPVPSEAERMATERRLWEMGGALEAIWTANWALYTLLRRLEIRPDVFLGHSSGEFSALVASGILAGDALLLERTIALGAVYERMTLQGEIPAAVLAAVGADRNIVTALLEQVGGQIYVSMDNCAHQVVIVGREAETEEAIKRLRGEGIICQRLPFNRAYHTPFFAAVTQPLREFFQSLAVSSPEIEIYSCSTMGPYPREERKIRDLIVDLWSRPVEFKGSIEALYDAGVRIFVEVGPRGNLAAFVGDILRGRPHLAIGCDVPRRSGITQLNHLIGLLAAQGVGMRLNYLYEGRSPRRLALDQPTQAGQASARHAAWRPVALDLPKIRLSPERARALVPRSSVSAEETTTPPTGHDEREPMTSALDLGRLPLPSDAISPFPGTDSQVMQGHLQIMERFLEVEREVMETFLGREGVLPAPSLAETPRGETPPAPSFPFAGTIASLVPGQEVVIRRRLDPAEDIFLQDHCFGGRISEVDERLRPLPVVPLTMCMEIMAEAAAMLMPGQLLSGMRQIQIRQWLEVGAPITLEVTARKRASGPEVDVQVRVVREGTEAESPSAPPAAEGIATFAGAYPQLPSIADLSLTSPRSCRHTGEEMYARGLMFHGPRFRAVDSLDSMGENGIVGHLRVLSRAELFRSTTAPHLVTDPVLLDAAGQLLGYWGAEQIGYVAFPFRVSALEIYGRNPEVSEQVRCEVEMQEVTPQRLLGTMNLFRPDGRLLMRLVGWEDRRLLSLEEFFRFFRFSKEHLISKSWEAPIVPFPNREALACQRLDLTPENTRTIVGEVLASMILSHAERQQFRDLKGPQIRRSEWLFGRVAAKDAVRCLVKARHGVEMFPADVEIGHDQDGRPSARLLGLGEWVSVPLVSISHTGGLAVGVAGLCAEGQHLGVDVERVTRRDEAFQEVAFRSDELLLLDTRSDGERDEWVTRFWCAKEAVSKALGTGLTDGPLSLTVCKWDPETGIVQIVLGDKLARERPELTGYPLVVYTAREEEWVVASTLCERSYPSEPERRDHLG